MRSTLFSISLLLFAISIPPVFAQEETGEVYLSLPISDSDIQYIQKVEGSTLNLEKDDEFNLRVAIEPKTVKKPVIFDKKWITPQQETLTSTNDTLHREWIYDATGEIWETPRLRMAWEEIVPDRPVQVSAKILLDTDEDNQPDLTLTGEYPSKKKAQTRTREIKVAEEEFVAKSNFYLIRRELGLGGDSRWQYVQHEASTVVQKRIDVPAKDASTIKIYLKPGTILDMAVLSLDTDGNGRRDQFLLYNQMQHRREIERGSDVEIIDLQASLSGLNIDVNKTVVLEPILYIQTPVATFLQEKPIQRMEFFTDTTTEPTGGPTLMDPVIGQVERIKTLEFDLEKGLEKLDKWNGTIHRIEISTTVPAPQQVVWQGAYLCDVLEDEIPAILEEPQKRLNEFLGFPFIPEGEVDRIVTGFRPVFWERIPSVSTDTRKPVWLTQPIEDKDFLLQANQSFYQLEKTENTIILHGLFAHPDASVRIFINKRANPSIFRLHSQNVVPWIETTLPTDQPEGLHLRYPIASREYAISIPEGEETSILLLPQERIRSASEEENALARYQSWDFAIVRVEGDSLVPVRKDPDSPTKWIYSGEKWNGRTYLWSPSLVNVGPDSVFHIVYESEGVEEQKDITLLDLSKPIPLPIPENSRIKDADLILHKTVSDPNPAEITLFQIQTEEFTDKTDYRNTFWWMKASASAMIPDSTPYHIDKTQNKIYLWNKRNGDSVWRFAASNLFHRPMAFVWTGTIPALCEARLILGEKEIPILQLPIEISFETFGHAALSPILEVRYRGSEQILIMDAPQIKYWGEEENPLQVLNQVRFSVDGKQLISNISTVPMPEEEWMELGQIHLTADEHTLDLKDSPFFTLKTVLMEAQGQYDLPPESVDSSPKGPSILGRLFRLGIKLGIVAFIAYLIYYFWDKIKIWIHWVWDPIWAGYKQAYWTVPEDGWLTIWGLMGFGLYGVGLQTPTSGENYYFTFGGIALVVAFWHLMRLLKRGFYFHFPKIAYYVYRGPGTPFISGFIVILTFTALFVSLKLEPIAEQLAVIGYYFLVVGVIGEFRDTMNQKNEDAEGEGEDQEESTSENFHA